MERAVSEKILDLLEKYSFDQLNTDQREEVLAELTEQEFRAYQLLMKESLVLSQAQELRTPSAIETELSEQLSSQFSKPRGLFRILTAGVPLWLVGLMAAGFYLFWNYGKKMNAADQKSIPMVEQIKEVPKYIYITDTIYKEVKSEPIVINKEVIKYIELEVPVIQEREPAYVAGSQRELGLVPSESLKTDLVFDTDENMNEQEAFSVSIGQSVSDDGALMELLDGMN